jgi:hypothetical protein
MIEQLNFYPTWGSLNPISGTNYKVVQGVRTNFSFVNSAMGCWNMFFKYLRVVKQETIEVSKTRSGNIFRICRRQGLLKTIKVILAWEPYIRCQLVQVVLQHVWFKRSWFACMLKWLRTGIKSLNEALVADKLINALGLLKLFWIWNWRS